MHNDFRIEKERVSVSLTTVSGQTLAGDVFVQPMARHRTGREEAPDILNAREPFFPFLTCDGELQLIAKRHVLEMELPAELEEEEWRAETWQDVEVTLVGGIRRKGVMYLDTVTGHARVLDFLNRTSDQFLTLHMGSCALLLNRELIERIRPLD